MGLAYLFQLLLNRGCRRVDPLERIHVRVEDFPDLSRRIRVVRGRPVGRVQVVHDFPQIVAHALQLSVQGLRERVSALALQIRGSDWELNVSHARFQRAEKVLKFGLLGFDEIEFVV